MTRASASHERNLQRGTIVRSNIELSATIRRAMKEKDLDLEGLARVLAISKVMADKLICGELVPSRHLENKIVEVLGVEASTVKTMSDRREQKSKAEAALEETRRSAQKKPKAA